VQNNEISTILFSMNPIYGREKSAFIFAYYVTKHPNTYWFTFILANEKKDKFSTKLIGWLSKFLTKHIVFQPYFKVLQIQFFFFLIIWKLKQNSSLNSYFRWTMFCSECKNQKKEPNMQTLSTQKILKSR